VARVIAVGDGVYRVEVNGRIETVYVAGPPDEPWAFWNGRVFRIDARSEQPSKRRADRGASQQTLTAPMPATVIAVHVKAGDAIHKGQTVLLLEAMKMELPIRAPSDAIVASVNCRVGELVQGDAVLVELR
jgi:biotin carboxyl carrier protein